jgi:hypothetical protein
MARRDNNGSMDDGNFYQHWQGKRTKMADVLTAAEVVTLEEVVAPLQEAYDGPPLGTAHEYPAPTTPKVSGHEPPAWLVEERRKERLAAWAERDLWHARAMAFPGEHYEAHVSPEMPQRRLSHKRRQIAQAYLERMREPPWGEWSPWQTVTRNGTTMQERTRQRL